MAKSKGELKKALAEILHYAKQIKDISNSQSEATCWAEVIRISYAALDNPNVAVIDKLRGLVNAG